MLHDAVVVVGCIFVVAFAAEDNLPLPSHKSHILAFIQPWSLRDSTAQLTLGQGTTAPGGVHANGGHKSTGSFPCSLIDIMHSFPFCPRTRSSVFPITSFNFAGKLEPPSPGIRTVRPLPYCTVRPRTRGEDFSASLANGPGGTDICAGGFCPFGTAMPVSLLSLAVVQG